MRELEVRAVGPADAALTVILLHGFGAPGDDLVDLAAMIDAPVGTRFLFPAGPLSLAGLYGDARAWWMLDLARIERALAVGPEDRSDEVPEGLAEARALIQALVDEVSSPRIVLGGFSQGAMLALDVALHGAFPIAGLALMSTTRINAAAWRTRFDRVKGVPILQSHGRQDGLLSFPVAVSLRDELTAAGARVEWIEFDGGHEIPGSVLDGLSRLLRTGS